jgi:hypothetical protein
VSRKGIWDFGKGRGKILISRHVAVKFETNRNLSGTNKHIV